VQQSLFYLVSIFFYGWATKKAKHLHNLLIKRNLSDNTLVVMFFLCCTKNACSLLLLHLIKMHLSAVIILVTKEPSFTFCGTKVTLISITKKEHQGRDGKRIPILGVGRWGAFLYTTE
jgi:hypothetical protein